MKIKILISLFLFSGVLSSQDTIPLRQELPLLSAKVMPFPITYGVAHGMGYIVMVEKSVSKWHSICFGYKYLYLNGAWETKNNVFIVEYRFHYLGRKDQIIYLSPYLKLRDMGHSEYTGSRTFYRYKEKSLGFGVTLGNKKRLGKEKSGSLNYFIGAGYFLRLNNLSEVEINGTLRSGDFEPDLIFSRLDFRLGLLIGLDFPKKVKKI